MVRAAVIGCGWIGGGAQSGTTQPYTHASVFKNISGIDLVAGCDTDLPNLRRFGKNWGVNRLYSDVAEFLAHEQVELLSICTSDSSHEDILRQVVEAGATRAIICEKPLATSAAEAHEAVELCASRGVSLYVNYQRRWEPSCLAIRQRIVTGQYGEVRAVHGYYVRGLVHNGVTWINLLRMLAGEVISVAALPGEIRELPDDPTLSAWMELENGASVVMRGMRRADYSLFEMDILCSAWRVALADSGRDIRCYRALDDADYTGFRHLGIDENRIEPSEPALGLMSLVQEAIQNLVSGKIVISSGEEAVRDLEIAELIRRSAENQGRTLQLPL